MVSISAATTATILVLVRRLQYDVDVTASPAGGMRRVGDEALRRI